jgi:hypothetical protein
MALCKQLARQTTWIVSFKSQFHQPNDLVRVRVTREPLARDI